MSLPFILFLSGIVLVIWLLGWSWLQRKNEEEINAEQLVGEVPAATTNDALLVSQTPGKLIYANEPARRWLGMNGGVPHLEQIAQAAQPVDSFLGLFAEEGQASFQIGRRWVEASSHFVPSQGEMRTVVVMRELAASTTNPAVLNVNQAMATINQIGEMVNAGMGVEQTLQALLTIVGRAVNFDAGEICLWDKAGSALYQRGWVGDSSYLIALTEAGGCYKLDEGITGWIARHRQPVLLADRMSMSSIQPKLADAPYRSFIAVPLNLGERFIGTLEFASEKPQMYTPGDLALLQAVSTPVAVSIHNAELYTEQVQRVQDLATLQQVVSAEPQADEETRSAAVFAALNSRVAQLMDTDMCGIFLFDEERGGLVPEPPFHGLPEALVRTLFIPMPPASPQYDIWTSQPYWVSNDVEDEALVAALGLKDIVGVAGIINTAWMPLQIGDQRIGVIAASNKHADGGFAIRDIQNFSVLATQAAIVIENLRLYQREKRLDMELVGLQEITNAIGALSHETEFYTEITSRIANLMGIAMCGVMLYNPETRKLVSQLPFYGVADDLIRDYEIHLEPGSVMEQLWDEERYWASNHVQTDTLVYAAGLNELAEEIGIQQTLIAVLQAGGRKLGVVQVSNKLNGEDFNDSDIRLLLIFATQAAAIIENARLYQEARSSAEQAQGLRRVAELAGNVLTTQETFAPVLAEVARLMDSEIVYINVLDQRTGSLVTYPRWVHGIELSEPIVQDIYSPGFEHSVTVTQQPYFTNNIADDRYVLPSYKQIATRMNLKNSVLVPLMFGERTLGELGVANRIDAPYGDDDLEVMQVVAAQCASALDRLLLYEETGQNLTRRMQELDAISRVSNELTLTLDLDQILNVIREESVKAIGATGSTVALLQHPDSWKYPDVPQMERRLGDVHAMPKLADIELEAISRGVDAVTVSDYEFSPMAARPEGVQSALAAAIIYLDRVVGVIHLYHTQSNHFDDSASTFLMTMAAKAALGYGNAMRYQEQIERNDGLRRRVEQLSRLSELGHMFQTNTDPQMILEAIAYSVQQSVGFDVVVMTLLDEDSGELYRVAQAGLPMDVFEKSRMTTISQQALENIMREEYRISESYFFPVEDVGNWYVEKISALSTAFEGNRTIDFSGRGGWCDGDMLLVPLKGATGKLIGVMSLDRPHNNRRPDRSMLEVLEIFAHQAATTLENTQLYLSSVNNAEQEARLSEITEAVSRTLDVEEIVRAIARGALKMLPFTRMTVALADVEGGFDLIRVIVQMNGTIELERERQYQLTETALNRTMRDGLDYVYRLGDVFTEELTDLHDWYLQGEKISLVLPLLTGGECIGAIHIGSDLTDAYGFEEFRPLLKRMAQLVASSVQNARLFNQAVNLQVLNRSVVESIQQGIIVLDNSARIIAVNEFMHDRYGWDRSKDIIGKDLFEYQSSMIPFLADDLKSVLETGEQQERLNQMLTALDGSDLVSNLYTYPLRYGETVRGAVVLVEDVTERARLEQQMETRANQLAALTDVANRITASLERDEVVQMALEEIGWLIEHDAMTLWRRNGSYMVLEGAHGSTDDVEPGYRFLYMDYELTHQVVETRRVVTVGRSSEVTQNLPIHQDAESWMGVPLVNQGHVVGMILLTSSQTYAYDGISDQNIAFAFASQVAIALANADLFEQTFDRTNELGTLLEAATATSMSSDLNSVFRTVVELMFSALEMDDCSIMIWDDVDNQLEVQVDMNRQGIQDRITPKGTRYDLKDYPAKLRVLQQRDVVVISHEDTDSPYTRELAEVREAGDTARLLVPLVVGDESIGLIQLEQVGGEEVITQQKVRLARALGSQVAIAIQNARLSEQTNKQFEESLMINDLSRAISSTLDLDDMIEVVGEQLPTVSGADELYLALYEPETEHITFPLAVRGGQRYEMPPRSLGVDEVSFVIKHRRPLSLGADYFSPDELRKSMGIVNGEGDVRSYMGVPLMAGDEVVGVLAVRDSERTRAFDLTVQRILTTIGSQLGAAIQNARLFKRIQNFAADLNQQVEDRTFELEEERDRIDTLYQITAELARTLDMDRLMPRALGMVAKAVNAQDGVIMQLDPITDQLYSRAVLNPHSLHENPEDGRQVHPAEKVARFLIEYDEHVVMVDDLHQEAYWDHDEPGAADWRSALAVLLETNEELLGVMVLLSRSPNAFVESHLRLMVAAANQVASSINNAELYKLIRDQAERLGALLRAEQEEAEKNKAIVEGIADGVILADSDGRIILFNTAAERILDIPRDQAMGQLLSQLTGIYGAANASMWVREFESRYEDLSIEEMEGRYIDERIQLDNKTVSVHLSPVFTGDKYLGTVSVIRDITREVESERSKSIFIESVSHEFRTPLTPIKGFIDIVLMGAAGAITDGQKDILGKVKNNVDRLALLVDDVLEISKLDQGRDMFKIVALDLTTVVNDVLESIKSRSKHATKDLNVVFNPPESLPMVEADKEKMTRVIRNLVDNAFNYTPNGGTIEITIEPDRVTDEIYLSIRDTGVGIPEEFYDSIWQRFTRHEETVLDLEVAGTGLGLPIVKELVELHNGSVWFESQVGQGTTFHIRLPLQQPDYVKRMTTLASTSRSN